LDYLSGGCPDLHHNPAHFGLISPHLTHFHLTAQS
jgi:hypothetical protein